MKLGCWYCSNKKVLTKFNDLALTHYLLAIQAHDWHLDTRDYFL